LSIYRNYIKASFLPIISTPVSSKQDPKSSTSSKPLWTFKSYSSSLTTPTISLITLRTFYPPPRMKISVIVISSFLAAIITSAPSPLVEARRYNVLEKLLNAAKSGITVEKRETGLMKRQCCSDTEALICALEGALECRNNDGCDWDVVTECSR
jgi:hypothetical protein